MQKQIFLLILGSVVILYTIYHAIKGKRTAYWGVLLFKSQRPVAFWATIGLDFAIGVTIVLCGYFCGSVR